MMDYPGKNEISFSDEALLALVKAQAVAMLGANVRITAVELGGYMRDRAVVKFTTDAITEAEATELRQVS